MKVSKFTSVFRLLSKKQLATICGVGVLVFVSVFGYRLYAASYSGTYYGRAAYRGYFYNVYDTSGSYVLPHITSSMAAVGTCAKANYSSAIPSCINTVYEFVKLLKNANNALAGNTYQRKAGSAFIYYTMMGYNGSSSLSKVITTAQWDSLTAALNSATIDWNYNVSASLNSYYQGQYSNSADDAFYAESVSSEPGIRIAFSNGDVYYLKRSCANPVGTRYWKVSVRSSVNKTSANVGDTVSWTHTLKNEGPYMLTRDVGYYYKTYKYDNSGNLVSGYPIITSTTWKLASGSIMNATSNSNSSYIVKAGDYKICRSTISTDISEPNTNDLESSKACVTIAQDYDLTPSVTVNPSGDVEVGSDVSVTPKINNSGVTASLNTQWQLVTAVFATGTSIKNLTGGSSSSIPCTYLGALASYSSCSVSKSGTGASFSSGDTNPLGSSSPYEDTIGDYTAGTHICYMLSAQPRSSVSNQWAHSDPVCIVIGKKPKAQIIGGDLWAASAYASTTVKNNRMYGSWVEYAIFTAGTTSGIASGSAFAGGLAYSPLISNFICGYNTLSFTNSPSGASSCSGKDDTIGNYSNNRTIPDVKASFPGGSTISIASVTPNSLLSSRGTYIGNRSGNLSINTSNLSAGKTIVIKVSGTATITGNQTNYSGTYTNIKDIPQLVIIADKIVINNNVTNVDAWLIATNNDEAGSIQTCSSVAKTVSACNSKLTINGPVMTDKLYLYRTAGSGTGSSSGDPAEVINLRADAYLWAYARAINVETIQTVYSTELPPRF